MRASPFGPSRIPRIVSACVMAHVNTTGRKIGLYLDSPVVLGLGRSNAYPMQEGAFFGNIFVSPPQAYYCNGYDWDRGPVSGRIGATQTGSPYKNPFSGAGPAPPTGPWCSPGAHKETA